MQNEEAAPCFVNWHSHRSSCSRHLWSRRRPAKFRIEEATIEDIQAAILRGELTSTRVVQLYLARIKAYNGTCVEQPDGVLGAGPIKPIKNAHQLNALMTLNLRPSNREKLGFDVEKPEA